MPELSVTLLRATGLPVGDASLLQGSASDPFVLLEVAGEVQRSSCVHKSLDPEWSPAETFVFDVPDARAGKLLLRVVDNDVLKADELLGEHSLSLASLVPHANRSVARALTLDVPPELAAGLKQPSVLHLELRLTLEDDGQQVLAVWENEDWRDGKWVAASGREWRHWSSADGRVSSDTFEQVAPQVPDGLEGKGWAYATKRGDEHGWVYAGSFTGPWASAASATSYARRRLWQNHCRPAVACE